MVNWMERIDTLDISIFDSILSETGLGDRRSLLAIQRATARKYKEYSYLEIGSHLGGSIQPHLVDTRCKVIYSIDPRPHQQQDDRSPGYIAYYQDNSSERMLNMLSEIGAGDLGKIQCFEVDASNLDAEKIAMKPHIVFIDGEHTKSAVISDFMFSINIINKKGTILFHDANIIYSTIREICNYLNEQKRSYLPLKLEGEMFGIFFDDSLLDDDLYLKKIKIGNYLRLILWKLKILLRKILPKRLLRLIKK